MTRMSTTPKRATKPREKPVNPAQTAGLRRGGVKGVRQGGRKPGVPNKVTVEFRETVRALLERNSDNVDDWMQRVAWGVARGVQGKQPFVLPDGRFTFSLLDILAGRVPADVAIAWVVEPDPDKALQRIAGLAEYAAPKLARTEVVGDGGGAVRIESDTLLTMSPQDASDAYRRAIAQ